MLVAYVFWNSSALDSASCVPGDIAALFTTMSTCPNAVVRGLDERVDLIGAADVAADGERRAGPSPRSRARDRFAVLDLAARDHHVGARAGEAERDRLAEPAPAAGDDRDLAGEVEQIPAADMARTLRCTP